MAASDLTTLADVKSWMGIAGTAQDDDLKRLITAASDGVTSWLCRKIKADDYDLRMNGSGGVTVVLPQYPVTAVTSVTVNGMPVPLATEMNDGFLFDEDAIYLRGYTFCKGVQNVRILYTAGYAEVPFEVAQAVIELVSLRHKDRERIGLVSKGLAGETITFSQKDFTASIRTMLNPYRKVV